MSIQELENKARGTRALADAYRRQSNALLVHARDAEDRAHDAEVALAEARAAQIPTVQDLALLNPSQIVAIVDIRGTV